MALGPTDTIGDLKEKIHRQARIRASRQAIYYVGGYLLDQDDLVVSEVVAAGGGACDFTVGEPTAGAPTERHLVCDRQVHQAGAPTERHLVCDRQVHLLTGTSSDFKTILIKKNRPTK